MKFNSQICTTREQSERLIALGLKKETADMHWFKPVEFEHDYWFMCIGSEWCGVRDIPAWSLHRLIEMMPNKTGDYELNINARKVGYYSCVGWGYSFDLFEKEGEVFNCLIDTIEELIKEGYFNKEYLEE